MTLILGMSKPEGIYLCVDHRVTESGTSKLIDDAAVKHLTLQYPRAGEDDPIGPRLLLAYTGLAEFGRNKRQRTKVGDWIRETIRGESDQIDKSMRLLTDRLNRDLGRYRHELLIVGIAIIYSERWVVEISNRGADGRIRRDFQMTFHRPAQQYFVCAAGSGLSVAHANGHLDLLHAQCSIPLGRPDSHMKLLATVNRRVAQQINPRTVGPTSFVAFTDAKTDNLRSTARVYVEPGEPPVPFTMRSVFCGVDLSYFAESMVAAMESGTEPVFDPVEMQRNVDRRP